MVLATVSGFVDAFVYLRVYPVFTANQSGNLILAGIALGEGKWAVASVSLVALAAYMVGAGAGTVAFDADRSGGRPRFVGALGAEVVVLVTLVVVAAVFGRGRDVSREVDVPVLLMVAVTSLAMGLQGMALRRVHGVPVLTTGGTGNVTTIGERVGRLGAVRGRSDDELALGVISGVVVVYVLGAVLGALADRIEGVGPVLILVPVAGLAVTLLVQRRRASE